MKRKTSADHYKNIGEQVLKRLLQPVFGQVFGQDAALKELANGMYGVTYLVQGDGGLFAAQCMGAARAAGLPEPFNDVKCDLDSERAQRLARRFVVKVQHVAEEVMHAHAISESLSHVAMNEMVLAKLGQTTINPPLRGFDYSPVFGRSFSIKAEGVSPDTIRKRPRREASDARYKDGTLYRYDAVYRLTVMEYIEGTTLYDYVYPLPYSSSSINTLTLEQYVRLELALVMLWSAGLSHADLHEDNVMVSADGKRVVIIDFGFAVVMPEDVKAKMAGVLGSYLERPKNSAVTHQVNHQVSKIRLLNRAYEQTYLDPTRSAQSARHMAGFNPDSLALLFARTFAGRGKDLGTFTEEVTAMRASLLGLGSREANAGKPSWVGFAGLLRDNFPKIIRFMFGTWPEAKPTSRKLTP